MCNNDKCHFAIRWARSFQHQIVCKILSNIPNGIRLKFYFFSEFEPRQNLDQSQMNLKLGKKNSTSLKCHLTISWGTSCQYQCVCKILSKYSKRFKRFSLFPEFELRQHLDQSQMSFDYLRCTPCQHQCVCKISSQYSTQFKR